MIILDTDHISLLQAAGESSRKIEARLVELGLADSFPTTIISYEEQIRGWMAQIAKSRNLFEEIQLYERLELALQFFATTTIFQFTEKAATEFQRLRRLKVRIGTMDLKIASIALANSTVVFTRNLKDFSRVPGLRIEDASA